MSEQSHTASSMLLIIVILLCGWLARGFMDFRISESTLFECSFDHQASEMYTTNENELNKEDSLILVWRGQREYMFSRKDVSACRRMDQ